MSETWCPFAVKMMITTQEFTKQRVYPTVSACEHITAGFDSRAFLQNADNTSSVHFLIRMENGVAVIYQFMPIEWAAWGNGRFSRGNPYNPQWIRAFIDSQPDTAAGRARVSQFLLSSTISIEHEAIAPRPGLYTGPFLDASIRLNKWIADTVSTIKRDRDHIIGHYQIDHINRAFCPGGPGGMYFPFSTIVEALNPTPPQDPPSVQFFPETGHTVGHGFLDYFRTHGQLETFGYPITEEVPEVIGGWAGTVQYFQKARMEYHQEFNPPQVLTGLVGAELLTCRNN